MKNTQGGKLLLVKLQAEVCNFTKSNIPPWVFFTFFKLYKWYQIAQSITYHPMIMEKWPQTSRWPQLSLKNTSKNIYSIFSKTNLYLHDRCSDTNAYSCEYKMDSRTKRKTSNYKTQKLPIDNVHTWLANILLTQNK